MVAAPQFTTRDGTSTTSSLVLTTNRENIIFQGTVEPNSVDIQVSVNGAAFVSDPTLVTLDGVDFTIPNLSSFPDGLQLAFGNNVIAVRVIDIVGSVSPPATAAVTRVTVIAQAEDNIPTGVRVRRKRDTIDIQAARPAGVVIGGVDVQDLDFRGFNFHASTTPGGTSGYFRINEVPITETSTVFEEDTLDIDDRTIVTSNDGPFLRQRTTFEDIFGNELSLVVDTQTDVLDAGDQLKLTQTLVSRTLTEFIFFNHDRDGGAGIINSDQFVEVEDADPLYYVVSAVYYDPTSGEEFETPFSQEVLGAPLIIDTRIRDLPGRTQLQVVVDFVDAIQRVNEEIALIPGSTTRDVSIDPFSSEAERLWFIVDFVHRSQSFLTLLQVDDANGDGVSDEVFSSAYKQALKAALGFQTDLAVQTLIDTQFDKLAGNLQMSRLPGRPSVGQAVFYSTSKPSQDVNIASGTVVSTDADTDNGLPAVRFNVGGTFLMPAADADAFFNFKTQRYEVIADIVADTIGTDGNRPAGQIKNISGSVSGFQVTNTEATVFGTLRESNNALATRAELAFVSVDAGTEGGYAKSAAGLVGIVKTKIVKSGDALMMRDYDDVRAKHIGGKVDIWIQGLRERTVSERFAFTFEIARDIRCQIVDLTNLIFRVLDDRVTVNTPIDEILNDASKGLGVRNGTAGKDYDLTGVTIIDFETFQVDASIQTFTTFIDDLILADYRFRSLNQFTFTFQPVRRVISVSGESAGALDSSQGFDLFKTDDPLLTGESTIAQDFLRINQVSGVPTGATIQVSDESHVMIGFFLERLQNIGINTTTIRVFSSDRVTEYDGPDTASPDFEIAEGTATTPATIVRSAASTIVSGQTVVVDYEHDENFTVTYVINDLLQQLQQTIAAQRHVTADVLVKQAIANSVEIDTTVQLKRGATKDKTDPAVRSSVSTELNQKLIGEGSAQSDMINAIDSTTGVDFQVLPLARMGHEDGSRKLREGVSSASLRLPTLDIGGNRIFILTGGLQSPTTDGGGLETEHKGVFQDDVAMALSSTLTNVSLLSNQAYIIGAEGAVISGYSDDATIIAETGITDPSDIVDERLARTANHVVISLSGADDPQDEPDNHVYAASYVVRNDNGPHDITASQVEFIDLGAFVLTFREAPTT